MTSKQPIFEAIPIRKQFIDDWIAKGCPYDALINAREYFAYAHILQERSVDDRIHSALLRIDTWLIEVQVDADGLVSSYKDWNGEEGAKHYLNNVFRLTADEKEAIASATLSNESCPRELRQLLLRSIFLVTEWTDDEHITRIVHVNDRGVLTIQHHLDGSFSNVEVRDGPEGWNYLMDIKSSLKPSAPRPWKTHEV